MTNKPSTIPRTFTDHLKDLDNAARAVVIASYPDAVAELDASGDLTLGSAVVSGTDTTDLAADMLVVGDLIPSGTRIDSIDSATQYTLTNTIDEINPVEMTGSITDESAVVTVADSSALSAGQVVAGTGIQAGSVIAAVDSGTQITLDKAATATNAAAELTFNDASAADATIQAKVADPEPVSSAMNGITEDQLIAMISLTSSRTLIEDTDFEWVNGVLTAKGETYAGNKVLALVNVY